MKTRVKYIIRGKTKNPCSKPLLIIIIWIKLKINMIKIKKKIWVKHNTIKK